MGLAAPAQMILDDPVVDVVPTPSNSAIEGTVGRRRSGSRRSEIVFGRAHRVASAFTIVGCDIQDGMLCIVPQLRDLCESQKLLSLDLPMTLLAV